MIFDSEQIINLRKKYDGLPDYRCPQIIILDRSPSFINEREIIEKTLKAVPLKKRNHWRNKLLSKKGEQFIGAWFQIMLYNWLVEFGNVKIEPIINGDDVDFMLKNNNQEIVIEAHAIAKDYTSRSMIDEFKHQIKSIKKPYIIVILACKINRNYSIKKIKNIVEHWLSSNPKKELKINNSNYTIHLFAIENPEMRNVTIIESQNIDFDLEKLKNHIHKKASQHKNIRNAGYPYIIAILLDEPTYSIEEVINAWYGKLIFQFNRIDNTTNFVGTSFDKTGLHFFGQDIHHKSVSGTLVFKRHLNTEKKMHELDSWFIQNMYSTTSVNYTMFPTKKNFIVIEKTNGGCYMGWDK